MIAVEKPKHHIFLCSSSRMSGEPKGVCHRKDARDLVLYLQSELDDRGMTDCLVSNTGCLKLCDHGPVMIIYPEGYWYGNICEDGIDRILDALQEGKPEETLLI